MYEASLKEKWDYENVLASARREEGEKKYAEGVEQKSCEVVERLILKLGLTSDEQIADVANVSVDFVRKVRADFSKKKQ